MKKGNTKHYSFRAIILGALILLFSSCGPSEERLCDCADDLLEQGGEFEDYSYEDAIMWCEDAYWYG
jgi:hypothetical protein